MANNTILIVDDDAFMRKAARRVIAADGYDIHEAGNGIEALRVMEEARPTVVLLDLRMPEMDGFEFLRRVETGLEAPYALIAMTGMSHESDIKRCYELGINMFISKPFGAIELRELVRQAFAIKNFQAERNVHIAELERAREELGKSEAQLRDLINSMPAGVLLVDIEDGKIVKANTAALRLLGENESSNIIGGQYSRFFYPGRLGCLAEEAVEHKLLPPKGGDIPIMKSATPVVIDGERHVVVCFIDISSRKEQERQKLATQTVLLAEKARRDFLLGMSRRLREPLNALLSMASGALDGFDENGRELANRVLAASGELLDMVNDMIDTTNCEFGGAAVPLNLAVFAERLRRQFVHKYGDDASYTLKVELDADADMDVFIDEARARKIFEHLFELARQELPTGETRMKISLGADEHGAQVLEAAIESDFAINDHADGEDDGMPTANNLKAEMLERLVFSMGGKACWEADNGRWRYFIALPLCGGAGETPKPPSIPDDIGKLLEQLG